MFDKDVKITNIAGYSAEKLIELISKVNKPVVVYDILKQTPVKVLDEPMSWRGVYKLPVLTIVDDPDATHTPNEIIEILKEIDGRKTIGYKGGCYQLSIKDIPRFEYDTSKGENRIATIAVETSDQLCIVIQDIGNDFEEWRHYGKEVDDNECY